MTKVDIKVENPKFWDKNVVIGIISVVMTLFFGIIGLLNITVVWGKVFAYIGLAIAGFLTFFLLWLAFVRFLDKRRKDDRDAYAKELKDERDAHAKELNELRAEIQSLKEKSDKHEWCILDIRPEYELRYSGTK